MYATYKKIAEAQEAFKKLSNLELPILQAELIKGGILELDTHYGEIDKKREYLLTVYATKNDLGEYIFKDKDNEDTFKREYEAFLEKEVCLEYFPLTLNGLDDIKFTAMELIRLDNLVQFT